MDDGCGARWKAVLPFLLRFGQVWSGLVGFGRGDVKDGRWWMRLRAGARVGEREREGAVPLK